MKPAYSTVRPSVIEIACNGDIYAQIRRRRAKVAARGREAS